MKVELIISPSYEDGKLGRYNVEVDTDHLIPVPEKLRQAVWAVEVGVNQGDYSLFAGFVKVRLKRKSGPACLWGDSDAPDAEFTPVSDESEKDYVAAVLLKPRNDKFLYHTKIVILYSSQYEELYRDEVFLPVTFLDW